MLQAVVHGFAAAGVYYFVLHIILAVQAVRRAKQKQPLLGVPVNNPAALSSEGCPCCSPRHGAEDAPLCDACRWQQIILHTYEE